MTAEGHVGNWHFLGSIDPIDPIDPDRPVDFYRPDPRCIFSYALMVFCYWNWRGARLVFFDVPRSFLRISCSRYHRHCDCWFRLLVAR